MKSKDEKMLPSFIAGANRAVAEGNNKSLLMVFPPSFSIHLTTSNY
jgi:hypothetical protein